MAGMLLLAACGGSREAVTGNAPGIDIAEAALRGGSAEVALRVDDGILAKDPRNVAALINRGTAQTAMQQFDAAAGSYAAALEADPKSVQARIGLGRLRLAVDPGQAETLFGEATQRDARNAVAWNDLGIARDLLGRHDAAQDAYRQAISLDSSMTGAQVNLALSLAMAGRANDAAATLRPLASAPSAPRRLRHDLAAVLAMGGDRDEAQTILAKDLAPDEVNQALSMYSAAASTNGAAPGRAAAPSAIGRSVAASSAMASKETAPNETALNVATAPVRAVASSPVAPARTAAPAAAGGASGATAVNVVVPSAAPAPQPAATLSSGSSVVPASGPLADGVASNETAPTVVPYSAPLTATSVPMEAMPLAPGSLSPIRDRAEASVVAINPATSVAPAPTSAVTAPTVTAPAVTVPAVTASPVALIEPASAPVAAHRVSIAEAARAPSAGEVAVQLSAELSQPAAEAAWHRMQQRLPSLLADRQPILERFDADGKVYWRVRTGGFAGVQEAVVFCNAAKAQGAACFVTRS
jgi:Flp pilus assembly protein TadD